MTPQEMKTLLKERGSKVEDWLAGCCDGREMPPRLRESMLYSLQAGGKRLRPVLCMSTAGMCGLAPESVLPFAAAIEMVHTYSLIHDDLPAMDDDDLLLRLRQLGPEAEGQAHAHRAERPRIKAMARREGRHRP